MEFKDLMYGTAASASIRLNARQLEAFEKYYQTLLEGNKKMNLTAITEPKDVVNKHFIDSLAVFKCAHIPAGASVIDVGTGAGFPGAVMSIYRPDLKITLLDSLNKRLEFLKELGNNLKLKIECVHCRAEEGGRNPELREKFDVVVSRAVAGLNTLVEYCLPYAKVGGHFYALKGPQVPEEAENARRAVQLLGGKIMFIDNFTLPNGDGRAIIDIAKIKHTPEAYPRQSTKIKSKPL